MSFRGEEFYLKDETVLAAKRGTLKELLKEHPWMIDALALIWPMQFPKWQQIPNEDIRYHEGSLYFMEGDRKIFFADLDVNGVVLRWDCAKYEFDMQESGPRLVFYKKLRN